MSTITTARLVLSPVAPADIADIVALHSDPRVTPMLLDGIPSTPAIAQIFVDWATTHAPHGYGTFAARRRETGAFQGLFSLTPFEGTGELELGGKLAPQGWGRDLAVEAGAALIGHAFDTLARDRLLSATHPDNRAAIGVLMRLGFVYVSPTSVFGAPGRLHELSADTWQGQGARPSTLRDAVSRRRA